MSLMVGSDPWGRSIELRAGDRVQATGLHLKQKKTSLTALNGRLGTVQGRDGNRVVVRFDHENRVRRLKASNLSFHGDLEALPPLWVDPWVDFACWVCCILARDYLNTC